MIDYQKGKVYRICSKNGSHNMEYIGSTCDKLCRRLTNHVFKYSKYVEKKSSNYMTSFQIIETGDYQILLLEDVPCDRKEVLRAKEAEFIKKSVCVNKTIPNSILDAGGEKEYHNKYSLEYNKNPKRKEYVKKYYKDNKEHIQEKSKEYSDSNKEKITCECGRIVSRGALSTHKKTNAHNKK